MAVKRGVAFVVATFFLAVCATNTIEKLKHKRAVDDDALSPEVKTLVGQEQIRSGMTEDQVCIAWGKPALLLVAFPTETLI
jgi:outer membrane protein assembly factor BamE (lipoprotein component of BamABCDE complex)